MLTILTNPSDHNFSKSPVICEVETNNQSFSGDIGLHAKLLFYIPPNPNVNEGIELNTNSGTSTFVFTNATIVFAYAIPLRTVGQTDTQFYDMVLATIIASGIGSVYTVTYIGGGGFMFEAVLPGDAYSNYSSIVFNSSGPSAVGFSFTNIQDGTTNVVSNIERVNYKIGVDLYVERAIGSPSNVFDKIYSAEKTPINGRVKFDLAKIIDAQLEYYFPEPNKNMISLCYQTCKHFYVTIREMYGTPTIDVATDVSPEEALALPGEPFTFEALILKAGFAPRYNKVQPINQLDAYIWSYPLALNSFYTKTIKAVQQEFIYFCFPDVVSHPIVKLTTYLKNGTTAVTYQSLYNDSTYKGLTMCFPINPTGSEIRYQMQSKNAVKFVAAIVSNFATGVLISPEFTYIPDYNDLGDDKIFLYTNSMGGVDTFRSTGYYETDVEFEQEVSSRIYYTSDDAHLGDADNSQNYKSELFKTFSGWLTTDELNALEDLFLAKYKVELLDDTTFMPIIITSKKYRKHETNMFLKGVEIEYYHQLKSPVTNRLVAAL